MRIVVVPGVAAAATRGEAMSKAAVVVPPGLDRATGEAAASSQPQSHINVRGSSGSGAAGGAHSRPGEVWDKATRRRAEVPPLDPGFMRYSRARMRRRLNNAPRCNRRARPSYG